MGLIPAHLLLSNCKASLRENIDLLLIKSNYIFSPSTLYIQRFYNVIFSSPLVCTLYFPFNIMEQYYAIAAFWCRFVTKKVFEWDNTSYIAWIWLTRALNVTNWCLLLIQSINMFLDLLLAKWPQSCHRRISITPINVIQPQPKPFSMFQHALKWKLISKFH